MNGTRFRIIPPVSICLVGMALFAGCDQSPKSAPSASANDSNIQGSSIASVSQTNVSSTNAPPFVPADYSRPDLIRDGVIQLGWDKLSGFKYDVYEVYSETNSGRALIRSDDSIPAPMKRYDGKSVRITGFILPLRTRKGLVTEFLLLRDQGTCCFGARAQVNHFIRVKYSSGFVFGDPVPWSVSGKLNVGEIYIQGYLTGIYQLEATRMEPAGR